MTPLLVVHGTGTSPGRARGPLLRNRDDLEPGRTAGAVLVAERSSPDDLGRIVAAEGTLTLTGAFLSHVSLLSREFGRPSVSLGALDHVRLLAPEEGALLELSDVVGGAGPVLLEEGDVVVLDGDAGLLTIPGGADRGARQAVRVAHAALLRAAGSGDAGAAAAVLEAEGPGADAVLAYVLDALLLPGRPELPGTLLLEELLARPSLAARLRPHLPAVRAQAGRESAAHLRRATAAVRQASAVDAMDRRSRALTALVERGRSVSDGEAQAALHEAEQALVEAGTRRTELVRSLEDEVEEALALDPARSRLQIGRLSALFRKARAGGTDPERASALRRKVEHLVAGERERAGGRLVLALRADAPRDRAAVGGKAAGLIEAWPHLPSGCRIPPGFVVTASAYRLHLLGETGDRLRRVLSDAGGPAAASRRARAAILAAPVPEEVGAAVRQARHALGSGPLAVRSSGTHEDGAQASLAGMFETYLGVRTEGDLLDRLRRCWASQWSERALRALEAAGIPPQDASQAVLVQEMVPVVAAGVLLSHDPEGDPRVVVVNAAWGLGEAISQGEIPGDLYRIDRTTATVLARVRAPQRTRVLLDPTRPGTVDRPVPPELRDRPCLPDEVLSRLAALAGLLEASIGRALDLEFGLHEDGSIVLFQVRRVVRAG